jgi:hypothetical protein
VRAGNWTVESGSMRGLAARDTVIVDIAEGQYVLTKEGIGPVARVPVATTREDRNPINGWVELVNPAAGLRLTLSLRLDPGYKVWRMPVRR